MVVGNTLESSLLEESGGRPNPLRIPRRRPLDLTTLLREFDIKHRRNTSNNNGQRNKKFPRPWIVVLIQSQSYPLI